MDSPSQPDAFSFDIKIKVHLFEDFASSAAWVMGNMFDDDNDGAVAKKNEDVLLAGVEDFDEIIKPLDKQAQIED